MHEKLLSAAVLPQPYRILGLDMMPYSLGCELQLFRDDSQFLTMDRDEFDGLSYEKQLVALIRGVNTCCRRPPRWFWLWSKAFVPRGTSQLALAIADFRNYLADGRLQFRYELPPDEDGTARYLGEPELLRLYRFILKNVPVEEIHIWGKTAWDFPYSFAKMLAQGHAESEGNIIIYNVQQQKGDDFHRECMAAREAWAEAGPDAEKRVEALKKYPLIRQLIGLEEEVAAFEQNMKGDASCPV